MTSSPSSTTKHRTGCGTLYATRSAGFVTASLGKAGGCAAAQVSGLTALASLAMRHGATAGEVAAQLHGISCPYSSPAAGVLSCGGALAEALGAEEK
jgi:ribonucleoside-diphosphate reductase alpha chain